MERYPITGNHILVPTHSQFGGRPQLYTPPIGSNMNDKKVGTIPMEYNPYNIRRGWELRLVR
jgi:hypothetical protein